MKRKRVLYPVIALLILALFAMCVFALVTLYRHGKDARALCSALEDGDMDRFCTLLEEGAYANGQTHSILYLPISVVTESDSIKTPLQEACLKGNAEAVSLLLQHGADPNKHVPFLGFSCIGCVYASPAGRSNRLEIVPMLLSSGASPSGTGHQSQYSSAVFLEAKFSQDEVFERSLTLIAAMEPDYPHCVSKEGDTLLHELSRRRFGFDEPAALLTAHLIECGADVDAANKYGQTPLMIATMYGNTPMVELLLDAGCSAEAQDNNGKTAADYASESGN